MAKKPSLWAELDGLDGEVDEDYNSFDHVLRSSSPSFNWLFSNSHGLPLGLAAVLIGPAKSGKSLIVGNILETMQEEDPEAMAIVFDTEMRYSAQSKTKLASRINRARVKTIETNVPSKIFDVIEHNVAAWQQKYGNKIKLIVIDSLSGIAGRRTLNADSVDQMQIGDRAATLGEGLSRILPIIRKYKIALICTAHVRAEITDKAAIMRGETLRANLPWAAKHMIEYWISIDQDKSKAGKVVDEGGSTDIKGHDLQLGHKINCKMVESSLGPKNRMARFTLRYDCGISDVGEEVADLATELGVIEKPNNVTYKFGEYAWRGRNNMIEALESNSELRKIIIDKIKEEDLKNIVVS